MSKFTKLVRHPVQFFEDANKKKKEIERLSSLQNPVFAFRVNDWKRPTLEAWMPDKHFIYVPFKTSAVELEKKWLPLIEQTPNAEVLVWNMNLPPEISRTSKPVTFVEDGFVRSVELGSHHSLPMSLAFDKRTAYFNANKESDLERLLSTHDFDADPALMTRARKDLARLLETGISKYNSAARRQAADIYPATKSQKRILVVGQVEEDASIIHGCEKKYTNNDAVHLAVKENPDAEIYYKPHPDVLHKRRSEVSSPDAVKDICTTITDDIAVSDVLQTIDHVYTITSLVGMEALLRGIKVTTLGCPFYSGWGLTDDRQACPRRQRKLTLDQLFAGAYELYPQYFDPVEKKHTSLGETIETIHAYLEKARAESAKRTPKKKPAAPAAEAKEKVVPNAAHQSASPAEKASAPAKTASAPAKKASAPVKKTTQAASKKPSSATKKAASSPAQAVIPDWYNADAGYELKKAMETDKPVYLYIPWIAEHTNTLIKNLEGDDNYVMAPLDFINDLQGNRRQVLWFARDNPHLYRRMIIRRLIPLRERLAGVVFTFDWAPIMRIISHVCEELGIPRILVPHESVFVDRDKYYWDPKSFASQPIADAILGWGGLQESIFVERGYPQGRFVSVGAPKFDKYTNYRPQLERQQFYRLFGLMPNRSTVLYATQPLDSQLDTRVARQSQRDAVTDLLDLCEELGMQLIVRLPPSKDNILGEALSNRITQSSHSALDDAVCYMVSPEEAIFHADIVASVNSTMLFEGFLMGRMPISTKYVEFTQIWENCNFPIAHDKDEIKQYLEDYLASGFVQDPQGLAWAAGMFSNGQFDGQSTQRIREFLIEAAGAKPLTLQPSPLEKIFSGECVDVIGIPSSEKVWSGIQKYLPAMLNVNHRVWSGQGMDDLVPLADVDLFVQWGITERPEKARQLEVKNALGRELLYVEDGFIRSLDIGLSGEPGLSIILDDTTSYYDATRVSRLERRLQEGPSLTPQQTDRAQRLIAEIVDKRISKYNHAPHLRLPLADSATPSILLVDQRYGDQSVVSGWADEDSFEGMLQHAVNNYPHYNIIIKQHPDAIGGGKKSYLNNDVLEKYLTIYSNIHVINYDVNAYSLFDVVDEVHVVTSGMGFEALMAGKRVAVFGAPFYAGWGVTQDHFPIQRRTRARDITEIFHYAYIELSRYYSPEDESACQLESLIDYICRHRRYSQTYLPYSNRHEALV